MTSKTMYKCCTNRILIIIIIIIIITIITIQGFTEVQERTPFCTTMTVQAAQLFTHVPSALHRSFPIITMLQSFVLVVS